MTNHLTTLALWCILVSDKRETRREENDQQNQLRINRKNRTGTNSTSRIIRDALTDQTPDSRRVHQTGSGLQECTRKGIGRR